MSQTKIRKKAKKAMIQPALKSLTGLGSGFGRKKYVDCHVLMPISEDTKTDRPVHEEDGVRYVKASVPVCAMSYPIERKLRELGHDINDMSEIAGSAAYDLNIAMLNEILSPDGWRDLVAIDGEEIEYNASDHQGSIELFAQAWIPCALVRSFSINLQNVAIVDDEGNSESGSEEPPTQVSAHQTSEPTPIISTDSQS